ncbi:MAG: hypothetical protein ACI9HX_001383, partial [Pseudoalteromonas tetraodonis]
VWGLELNHWNKKRPKTIHRERPVKEIVGPLRQ